MKFGNICFSYQPPEETHTEVIERFVNLGIQSEKYGFDNYWILEHHFTEFGLTGNLFVAAANILGRTTKLEVGTTAVVIPTAHPTRQLEDVLLLDQMSNGRFIFGINRGLYDKDFRVFGADMDSSREITHCFYNLFNESQKTGRMVADTAYIKFPEVNIYPEILTKSGVPILTVSESSTTTEWAARYGIPMIISWIIPTTEKKAQIELYNEIATEYGHDISKIDHRLTYITSVDEDSTKAKELCRKFLANWYDSYVHATRIFDDCNQIRGYDYHTSQWREFVLKGHKDTNRRVDYSYEINPVGTPEECIEIIQRDIDATGITSINCGFEANGTEEDILATMDCFMKKVAPFLKEPERIENRAIA
ncbi:LLM class flavin-dependent oxidoreductase [Candidatus Enterovibrio escicola]|uniref:bacterial luciferase n=2 Tax=Candidatus Enterovibrio escicola TaxID=1927127 RepID=A0A2A5T394_9GAMM|nr:LLM class flavin-dependent oxidoreductase [Candidatus Enterovibrio escacola]PCS22639.1 LuxA, luciferase alpha chain [Candidatus Enterovibrio escacola]